MSKEQTYDCETCQDTGEVSIPDYVYAGEPHMADVGTARCPDCNLSDDDEYDDQDDDY